MPMHKYIYMDTPQNDIPLRFKLQHILAKADLTPPTENPSCWLA